MDNLPRITLMNTRLTKTLLGLLLLAALVSPTHRAEALTTSPIRLELSANPGETISGEFELYNDARKQRVYEISIADFESKDETGQPKFIPEKKGLANWITLDERTVTFEPLERKKIGFTIAIPATAEPGGYFAAALASTKSGAPENAGDVAVEAQVGTLLLTQVNGNFVQGADILEFKTDGAHFFKSLPVDFYFRFQNEGASWVKPLGDIVIHNTFGGTSQIITANPDGSNVLPRSIRRFTAAWLTSSGETQAKDANRPEKPKEGYWNAITHQFKHFAFGRYTANLTLTYGDSTQTQTKATTSFWVIPWELLSLVIGSILVLSLFIFIVVYVLLKKILKRQSANKK